MAEKSIVRLHDSRKVQLLVDYPDWEHDPKSELKKLLMSNVKDDATDQQIMDVANAIITLVAPEDEARLDGVRDIQQFLLM